jgi:hypothetical protein
LCKAILQGAVRVDRGALETLVAIHGGGAGRDKVANTDEGLPLPATVIDMRYREGVSTYFEVLDASRAFSITFQSYQS